MRNGCFFSLSDCVWQAIATLMRMQCRCHGVSGEKASPSSVIHYVTLFLRGNAESNLMGCCLCSYDRLLRVEDVLEDHAHFRPGGRLPETEIRKRRSGKTQSTLNSFFHFLSAFDTVGLTARRQRLRLNWLWKCFRIEMNCINNVKGLVQIVISYPSRELIDASNGGIIGRPCPDFQTSKFFFLFANRQSCSCQGDPAAL